MGSLRVSSCWGSGSAWWGPSRGPSRRTGTQQPPPPPEAQSPPALDAPRTEIEALPSSRPAAVRVREQKPSRDTEVDVTATTVPPARVYVTQGTSAADRRATIGRSARRRGRCGPPATGNGTRIATASSGWRGAGRSRPPGRSGWPAAGCTMPADGTGSPAPGVGTRIARRIAANRPAWRTTGPPAEQPDDTPPPAPGPDFFYVPGHYAPAAGDRLAWVPGFWASVQLGWDWIPARWVRRPDGWDFREGHWMRDPDAAVVVERVPARLLRRGRRNANVTVITRDPITGAEVERPGEWGPRARRRGGRRDALLRHPAAGRVSLRTGWRRRARHGPAVRPPHPGPGPALMIDARAARDPLHLETDRAAVSRSNGSAASWRVHLEAFQNS